MRTPVIQLPTMIKANQSIQINRSELLGLADDFLKYRGMNGGLDFPSYHQTFEFY